MADRKNAQAQTGGSMANAALIDVLGGEAMVRKLTHDFYDFIETDPRGANIMDLHFQGHGMSHVRAEQFDFLSGFLGGRRYYEENHGHMDVRAIHAHVPITTQDAEDWLYCMDLALEKNGLLDERTAGLRAVFRRICYMLVNDGKVVMVTEQ